MNKPRMVAVDYSELEILRMSQGDLGVPHLSRFGPSHNSDPERWYANADEIARLDPSQSTSGVPHG